MPTREELQPEPYTAWTFSRQEFEKALGIPDAQYVTTVYVDAREIRLITHFTSERNP